MYGNLQDIIACAKHLYNIFTLQCSQWKTRPWSLLICFSPQGPYLKSASSQKSFNLSYLYSLLQFSVFSSSGKNPDSESWKPKSPVSSLNHKRRQTERLALERWGFYFSHFTFFQDNLKMSVSSVAKLYVSFNYSVNKFPFSSILLLFNWHRSYSLFLSLHCINFMGSVTFLNQKVRIGSNKEKALIPKVGC